MLCAGGVGGGGGTYWVAEVVWLGAIRLKFEPIAALIHSAGVRRNRDARVCLGGIVTSGVRGWGGGGVARLRSAAETLAHKAGSPAHAMQCIVPLSGWVCMGGGERETDTPPSHHPPPLTQFRELVPITKSTTRSGLLM
jgi:hypothetical protein